MNEKHKCQKTKYTLMHMYTCFLLDNKGVEVDIFLVKGGFEEVGASDEN